METNQIQINGIQVPIQVEFFEVDPTTQKFYMVYGILESLDTHELILIKRNHNRYVISSDYDIYEWIIKRPTDDINTLFERKIVCLRAFSYLVEINQPEKKDPRVQPSKKRFLEIFKKSFWNRQKPKMVRKLFPLPYGRSQFDKKDLQLNTIQLTGEETEKILYQNERFQEIELRKGEHFQELSSMMDDYKRLMNEQEDIAHKLSKINKLPQNYTSNDLNQGTKLNDSLGNLPKNWKKKVRKKFG
jgi:hypothetical protein